jgi:ribosomal protein L39E
VVEEATVVSSSHFDAGSATEGGDEDTRQVQAKTPALEGEVTTDTPREPRSAFFSAGLSDLAKEMEALIADIKKAAKHALWFGDRSNSASYLRNARSIPDDEHKPVFRRTFLNAAIEHLPVTRRTPPSVREKEASAMRAMRAKEDVVNYKKPMEERLEDIQRPRSLAEWGGFVEARIREDMDNFKGSSVNLMDLCNQPEYNNPYLDSTTRIMYRIMKKNDCLPYWLQLDKDIKHETEELRRELADLKLQWRREATSSAMSGGKFVESHVWKNDAVQARLAKKVKKLNGQILNFNLVAPHMNFQKFYIDLAQEADSLVE